MGRRTTLVVGLAAVVVASTASWVVGRQIQSPAELAARTAAPTPSTLTAPVELRQLSADVVVRGTVRYGVPQSVTLPTSVLKPSKAIVTTAPTKGSALGEGEVALALSGRPVFVLQGAQPAYRDLGPGSQGEDVRQLEDALARLGFDPGPVNGIFDAATAAAVATWYDAAGWTALGATDEQVLALRTAQADQFGVRADLLGAREGLATAQAALTSATTQVADARAAAEGGPRAEAAAAATSASELAAAHAEVLTRTAALASASDEEHLAQLQLDEVRLADPPPVPSELARAEATLRAASAAVEVARGELAAAQAAEAAVAAPVVGAASGELGRAVRAGEADAAAADEAVALAQRKVSLLAGREREVTGVTREVGAKLGIQVPADELLFFPNLPLRIDDVTAKSGEELAGPVMTVTTSELAVDAAVTSDDAKLVRAGAPVTIEQPDLAIRTSGTVSDVATSPGTQGVDPQRFYLAVRPAEAPAALVGTTVVLTIAVQATQGEVLAVPVAALSVAADRSTRVQVQAPDGTTRSVGVTPGLSAKGLVAITPDGGSLAPGDLVVVGTTGGPGGGAGGGATAPATSPPAGPATATPSEGTRAS